MKKGSEGFDVIVLQARLNRLDYPVGKIDGDLGVTTDNAIRLFQKDNKLTVDGIAGNKTIAKLEAATKNAWLFYFIHCSATPEGKDLRGEWVRWLHTKKKGWSRTGYPDVICLDGVVESLQPWDTDDLIAANEYTFGVKGGTKMNRNAIHLCYIGGLDVMAEKAKDTRTPQQKNAMEVLIKHAILRNPKVIVAGHNQVQRKACPSFDVPSWLRTINVSERNIAQWTNKFRIR